MRFRKGLASLCFLSGGWAHACTVCDSSGGRQLRATIFDGSFAGHLLLVSLPFLILAACLALVRRITPELDLVGETARHSGDGA